MQTRSRRLWGLGRVGLVLSLLLAARPGAGSAAGDEPEKRDMRATLAAIAEAAPGSAYQGNARIQGLRRQAALLTKRGGAELVRTLHDLGVAELRFGLEVEAIEHLEQALELVGSGAAAPQQRAQLLRSLAVASLRLAETENCCKSNQPESCIVPLRDGAIHTRTAGSTAAIGHLTELLSLEGLPPLERNLAVWLLNLAHMTLDQYPDGVDESLRIDPAQFTSSVPFPAFTNVAKKTGLDTFNLAGGVVVEDLDGDGDFDIAASTHDVRSELRVFLAEGDEFRDASSEAGLDGLYGGLNLAQGDYDGDGRPDLLVLRGAWLYEGGQHPNSLLRNLGVEEDAPLRFEDVTFHEGLGEVHYPTQTAAWADYDRDGDLDVYIGNESSSRLPAPSQLFRNDGPGTAERPRFIDIAEEAGVANLAYAKGVVWGDYDADGDPDLFVSNFRGENRLYRNDGEDRFTDVARELGVHQPVRSFPAWFWDYDNDGVLDLFISNYAAVGHVAGYYTGARAPRSVLPRFLRGKGDGTFEDRTQAVGLDRPMMAMGCNIGDLDNDGFLEFYLGTGHPDLASIVPNLLFWNNAGKSFVDVTMAAGFGHLQKGHAIAFADLDADGDQDVFEQMGGAYEGDGYHDALFENPGCSGAAHWIGVQLVGTRSNRGAVGARIEVQSEGPQGSRSVFRHVGTGASFGCNPLEEHIGLGSAERVVRVLVRWPATGVEQVFEDLPLDRRVILTEGEDAAVLRPAR